MRHVAEEVEPFVAHLDAYRRQLGMGQNEFARHLGVNETVWKQVRRGLVPMTHDFVGRVIRRSPELARYLTTSGEDAA